MKPKKIVFTETEMGEITRKDDPPLNQSREKNNNKGKFQVSTQHKSTQKNPIYKLNQ